MSVTIIQAIMFYISPTCSHNKKEYSFMVKAHTYVCSLIWIISSLNF